MSFTIQTVKGIMTTIARFFWLYEMIDVGNCRVDVGAGKTMEGELQMKDILLAKADGPMVEFRAGSWEG